MSSIAVKGERDGLVLILPPEDDNPSILAMLRSYLEQSGPFFKGASVTLDVGERVLNEEELQELRVLLEEWEVQLQGLRSSADETRAAAIAAEVELPFVVPLDVAVANSRPSTAIPEESVDALLVRRTLRSGQIVRHPGAIIVLGDVNPGAEIVAGGDVVVWGSLRGVVHAGAMGDARAMVCALKLSPMQLRISDKIAIAPESKGQGRLRPWQRLQQSPEVARIHQGGIVVEAWPGKK
ncbi:MAG: septum site-determining protein MinC [Ardenticatenales bacterium]|nr:septum site-determining protein MinC [Ardenticatenales bacterium]